MEKAIILGLRGLDGIGKKIIPIFSGTKNRMQKTRVEFLKRI
jgi:hypothetical protein